MIREAGVLDPFAHLHEEGYEAAFMLPRLTAKDAVFMGGRHLVSLNGTWRFTLDPFREGLRQKWFAHDAAPIEDWEIPRDYDDGAWQTIEVPGCWNMAREEWRRYEGAAWYSREFVISDQKTNRVLLRVGAANERTRVFLNGRFCGLHLGGSTPFFVDLTARLRSGSNHLMIEVDNTRRPDAVPMDHFDWFNYGGLYRDIGFVIVPAVCITDFRATLGSQGVEIALALSDRVDGTATIEILGLGPVEMRIQEGRGRMTLDFDPDPWTPETPRLYDIIASFGMDRVTDRVGFRRIEVSGTDLLLNGSPLSLRGICVHEDDREVGKCSDEADIRRRFAHLRDMGANAARLSHYPHHELAARIADEMGILLWEEIPVYWAIAFDDSGTFENARNQLHELILRDANRASVIIWGVGNENADTEPRLSFMRRLAETARALDPTRLIGAACLINRVAFRIEDRLAKHLDVIGLNEYFGWYEPGYEGLLRLLENSDPGKPVVISETGAEAAPGHFGNAAELFTENRQAAMLSRQVEIAAATPYVAGIFAWLLYDFRSDRRQTRHQRGWNRKGVIADDKMTQKMGYAALRAAYARHFNERN